MWNIFPASRYRHASGVYSKFTDSGDNKGQLLFIDGGRNFTKCFNDSYCYNASNDKWTKVRTHGDSLPARHSHSLCARSENSFYLSGGLFNDSEFDINTSLYVLEFADPFQCLVSVKSRNLPPVFGHTSHVYWLGFRLILFIFCF